MSETIRYSRIGQEDINFGAGTFEVRLADGRVVTLNKVDLGVILSNAALSTRALTLDSLTVTTLTPGTLAPTSTLQLPEKADPGSPASGEVWINSGAVVPEYADDQAVPVKHALVGDDTTQTLTNKTLTGPAISNPVLTGTVTGTYTLSGTITLNADFNLNGGDMVEIDEIGLKNAASNPTAAGRLRRNDVNLLFHDGTNAKLIILDSAVQTLSNKTLVLPVIASISNTGTITLPTATTTLVGKDTTDTLTNKTFDAQGTGNTLTNVSTSAMKTSTGSASASGAFNITMNDYSFFPSVTSTAANDSFRGQQSSDPGNTIGRMNMNATGTGTVRWRYITASDNPTIWIVPDPLTGAIVGVWTSDDPTPGDVPGIEIIGKTSMKLTSRDLEHMSVLSSKAAEADAYIRDRKLKSANQAYRALQLLSNDPAPSRWIIDNCEWKINALSVKAGKS